jgi:hypothetical protein
MAEIIPFPGRKQIDSAELARLRAKLLELHDCREAIQREIRITRDLIKLLEQGESK